MNNRAESKTKRRRETNSVSLFPFLAVLICTMGVLILLLVIFTHQARLQAAREVFEQKKADESQTLEQNEEARKRLAHLKKSRQAAQRQLAEIRLRLGTIEDHARKLTERLRQLEKIREQLQDSRADDQKRQRIKAELAETKASIAQVETDIENTRRQINRHSRARRPVIPYEGENGTMRIPICVECRDDAVILQPEGIKLTENDFDGPLGPENPLAAALRAAREHLLDAVDKSATSNDIKRIEPYPLLLVRPTGTLSYECARLALKSWGPDFGYELIESDWEIDYGQPALALAQVMQEAIEEARTLQRRLAIAAPRHYLENPDGPVANQRYTTASGGGIVAYRGPMRKSRYQTPGERLAAQKATAASRDTGNGNGYAAGSGHAAVNRYATGGGHDASGANGSGNSMSANTVATGGGSGGSGNGYGIGANSAGIGDGYASFNGNAQAGGGSLGGSTSGNSTGNGMLGNGANRNATSGNDGMLASSGSQNASGDSLLGTGNGYTNGHGMATVDGPYISGPNGSSGSGGLVGDAGASFNSGQTGDANIGNVNGRGGNGNGLNGNTGNGSDESVVGDSSSANGQSDGQPAGMSLLSGGSGGGGNLGIGSSDGGQQPLNLQANLGDTPPQALQGSTSEASRDPTSTKPTSSRYTMTRPQTAHKNQPVAGQYGEPLRPGEWRPSDSSRRSSKPDPSRPDDDKQARHKPGSLADARGKNWGLPGSTPRSTPLPRPIRVQCHADHLVLVPEQGLSGRKEVALARSTSDSVDEFVSAVWNYMDKSWGLAGKRMYWKPILRMEVAPGGEARFEDLKSLLEESGLEVERRGANPLRQH